MSKRIRLPVSDEHFRAIGRITVHMEFLHQTIQFCTWELIGAEQRVGQILTAGAPFNRSVNAIGALAKERLPEERHQALLDLLDRASRLEERRNEIIHSTWGGGGETPLRMKTRSHRKGIRFDVDERLSAAQLDEVANAVEETTSQLLGFFIHLRTKPSPSPPQ